MPAPVHPGRILKRELQARRISANRLALDLGVPADRVGKILAGRRAVSADTALRLGRYFGSGPEIWMNLQSAYDLDVAQKEKGAEIERSVRAA